MNAFNSTGGLLGNVLMIVALLYVTHFVYAWLYMRWLRHSGLRYGVAAFRRFAVMVAAMLVLAGLAGLEELMPRLSFLAPPAGLFVFALAAWELVYMWVFRDDEHCPETLLKAKQK